MEKITQPEQYISLLVYIIRADGIVDDDEQSGLLGLLAERLESPLDQEQTRSLIERLSAPGASEATDDELIAAGQGISLLNLCHLVRDAYALAASDGQIHGSEVRTMRRYLRLSGIPIERFADIDLWARSPVENLALGQDLLSSTSRL
jgi:uncharacterized tellurite resistance protein B-like protein